MQPKTAEPKLKDNKKRIRFYFVFKGKLIKIEKKFLAKP